MMPARAREAKRRAAARRRLGCRSRWAVGAAACAAPAASARHRGGRARAPTSSRPNPLVTMHPLSRQVQRHALFVTLARYDAALRPAPYYARRWTWGERAARRSRCTSTPALRWHDGAADDGARRGVHLRRRRATPPSARRARRGGSRWLDAARRGRRHHARRCASRRRSRDVPAAALRAAARAARTCSTRCRAARLRQRRVQRRAGRQRPVPLRRPRAPARAGRSCATPRSRPALGGPPRWPRLVVAVVDEATTKFAGLVSGELDVGRHLADDGVARSRATPTLRVVSYPVALRDRRSSSTPAPAVRRRARAPRRRPRPSTARRIVDVALAGYGTPADGPGAAGQPARAAPPPAGARHRARPTPCSTPPGGAAAPTASAARGGRPLAVELLTVGGGDNVVEQLVQADLAARGIRVAIRPQEMGAFLDRRARRRARRSTCSSPAFPATSRSRTSSALFAHVGSAAARSTTPAFTARASTLRSRAPRRRRRPTRAAPRGPRAAGARRLGARAWLYHCARRAGRRAPRCAA